MIETILMNHTKKSLEMHKRVAAADQLDLHTAGVEPFSPEALPYYSRWAREDLIMVVSLLTTLNQYARAMLWMLILVTVMIGYAIIQH